MWFLIRTAFWFALVLALLPIFSSESTSRLEGKPQVQVSEAVNAAAGVYQYATSLCVEKPDVCVKGGQTLTALGYRASEGARVAYEFLDNRFRIGAQPMVEGNINLPLAVAPAKNLAARALTEMQTMSPRSAGGTADTDVTGTIELPSELPSKIPIPQKRPAI
jgi:hypothetical protein